MKTSFFARIKIPHVFTLLLGVVFFCSLLTYLVPSGEYRRETRKYGELNRTVVVAGTYEKQPKHYSLGGILLGTQVENKSTPVSVVGFLSAVPRGMGESADIIFFIFIIGGVLTAMLSLAKIPYEKWLRFIVPLFLQLWILAAIFLAVAVWIKL